MDYQVMEGKQGKGKAWFQDLDPQEGHHRRDHVPPKAASITKKVEGTLEQRKPYTMSLQEVVETE